MTYIDTPEDKPETSFKIIPLFPPKSTEYAATYIPKAIIPLYI